MKITIEMTQQQLDIAARRYAEPTQHLQHCAHMMVHVVMQERDYMPDAQGNYTQAAIDAVLKLPTAVEQEQARKKEQADRELEQSKKEQALAVVLSRSPESQREVLRAKLERPRVAGDLSVEELAEQALQEAIKADAALQEVETQKRKTEFLAMLTDPELLAAAAKAQGVSIVSDK